MSNCKVIYASILRQCTPKPPQELNQPSGLARCGRRHFGLALLMICVILAVSACSPSLLSLRVNPVNLPTDPTTVNQSITVTGRLFYNDLRQYGHFDWRRDKNDSAGTQQDYAAGHRVNYLALRDATVLIYEIDKAPFGPSGCLETEAMGSTTVAEDGHFTWSGTLSDSCSIEEDAQNVSLAVKISLSFCDGAHTRCISVRDPGSTDDAVETNTFSRWHGQASRANPRLVSGDGVINLTDDEFEAQAAGTVTDLDAQAANVFASLVDVTRAFHVNDTVPFLYDEYGDVYVVFPTLRSTVASTYSEQRIDISAPGSGGGTQTPSQWINGNGPMHEYGHIIQLRAFDGNGNHVNYNFDNNDSWSISSKEFPQTAFTEGWANFVSRATLEDVPNSATTDYFGCSGDFDTGDIYGSSTTAPSNDGHWYPGNVTKALCDWFDSSRDPLDGTGDHWAASSLHSMWLNLDGMYANATTQQRNAGLDFCHWVDDYLYIRKAGDPAYLDSIRDLIENNGISCGFAVHFTVLTNNASATAKATRAQMKKEVAILNDFFVSESRDKIVSFTFKSTSLYADIQNSSCDLVQMSNDGQAYDSDEWEAAIDACSDPNVVDPQAINFFIYDNYAGGYSDITSRGRLNSYHPYVLIDWERLDHTTQSPEEHEMGHAFGLNHVCHPTATGATSTNIMATGGDYPDANGNTVDCPGSGGLRDSGFNPSQVDIIVTNALCIKEELDTGTNPC